jgi:predicted ester cyclase
MNENHIGLVRRALDEVASQGKLEALDEIASPEFVRHDLGGAPDIAGLEKIKRFIGAQRAVFGDLTFTADDILASGDRVAVSYTARGTHEREFQGIAPTGKPVSWKGINIYRIENGKLVETWQLADIAGLMRQLRG